MTSKMSVDNYFKYLNPQNRVLLEEYKKSTQNQMWATTIILSLTIIDNILSDKKNLDYIDGLDINHFKNSRDFHWLRLRRNQILHYEGPKEGFFESKDLLISPSDIEPKSFNFVLITISSPEPFISIFLRQSINLSSG